MGVHGLAPAIKGVIPVVLIGFMGAGKPSVGSYLALVLKWRFADLGCLIEDGPGRIIREIFAAEGVAGRFTGHYLTFQSLNCARFMSGTSRSIVASVPVIDINGRSAGAIVATII